MSGTTISQSITHGIELGTLGYGDSLTITSAGTIKDSTVYAIYAPPTLSGVNIVNHGLVSNTDTRGFGLVLTGDGGILTNTGSIYGAGIGAFLPYGGTIFNSGSISSGGTLGGGVFDIAVQLNDGYLDNSGNISATQFGVLLTGGAAVNSGTINSEYGTGVGLYGPSNSTYAMVFSNASTGFISAGGNGVEVYLGSATDSATIENAGTITGTGNGDGVALNGGTLDNSGTIMAGGNGVELFAEDGTIHNSGLIEGSLAGILLFGGNLDNTSGGTISGYNAGLDMYDNNTVAAYRPTLINAGLITGTNVGASLDLAAFLTNSGSISGQTIGIQLAGGTVLNTGSISGANYTAVNLLGSYLYNSGQLSGGHSGIGLISATAVNAGTITGGTLGVNIYGQGLSGTASVFTNTSSGHVAGGDIGVFATLNAGAATEIISNAGFITGTLAGVYTAWGKFENSGTVTSEDVGALLANPTLINDSFVIAENSGLIEGGTAGVVFVTGTFVNAATGTISGGDAGFAAYDTTTTEAYNSSLLNAGLITGNSAAVYLAFASLTNSGDIAGETFGIYLAGGAVTNSGLILSNGTGVYLTEGTVGNEQSLSNGKYYAVTQYGSLTNLDAITGSTTGVFANGGVLTDDGFISGGRYAIEANKNFTLNLANTAVLDGKVLVRSGTGVLNLTGNAGTLTGIGTSFSGFATIDLSAGASWTLEGNTLGLADGEQINGFTTGDILVLDGFAATSESLGAGGLVLSNGTSTETLNLHNIPFVQNFSVSSSSGNTSIEFVPLTSLVSTITSFVPAALQLGVQSIANNLTIANSGYVADIRSNPTLINTLTNFGTIHNAVFSGTPFFSDTLLNVGLISGTKAVTTYSYVNLTNTGTIIGQSSTASGIDLKYFHNTLTNSGEITSAGTAVYSSYGDAVQNTGIILGNTVLKGSYLYNSGNITGLNTYGIGGSEDIITNNGTIAGPEIGIAERFGGVVNNTGTISGPVDGISITGGTVVDSGLISGGAYAIISNCTDPYSGFFFTLDLELEAGARFEGAVHDKSGIGTLELTGSPSGSIDIGASFSGFSDISFATGAVWALEGAQNDLANGQVITGIAAGDSITLDSFAASTYSFITGTGLILQNTTESETLDIAGNFSTSDFSVSAANGATSILVTKGPAGPIRTISTEFHQEITLGAGNYDSNLTVTSTGIVSVPSYGTAITYASSAGEFSFTNAGFIGGVNLSGTVINSGTIFANTGINLGSGIIENSGLVMGNNATNAIGVFLDQATLENTGTIVNDSTGVGSYDPSYISNTGTISGTSYGISSFLGSTIVNSGLIESPDKAIYSITDLTLTNAGTIAGAVISSGQMILKVDPGAVFLGEVDAKSFGFPSTMSLVGATAGSIDIGASFSGFSKISFATGSSWTLEGTQSDLAAGQTISGFSFGDTIELDGFTAASYSYVTGSGLVISNGTATETLNLTGSFTSADFSVTATGTGTVITDDVACFLAGTHITTPTGKTPVESLKIGDLIKTTLGPKPIKWIGTRSYDGRFLAGNHQALPIRIRRHAFARNMPSRDLFVSPDHAICEGGVLVHARLLINGVSIHQLAQLEQVEYYHIELDRHAVIFAENTPVESYLDTGCRARFQNAATAPAAAPGQPCLPRIEDGYYLARLKSRIDTRAGLKPSQATGPMRGNIDEAATRLQGWAQDIAAPETPVELELLLNGKPTARFLANRYRADLRAAGLGSGSHAFDLPLPRQHGTVTLRRISDGTVLAIAPAAAA